MTRDRLGEASVVAAALDSGLLAALDGPPVDVVALAARAGLHADGVAVVLPALAALGLVEAVDGGWTASAALAALDASLPGGVRLQQLVWGGLPRLLRDGTTAIDSSAVEARAAFYPALVATLAGLWGEAPRALARALGPARRVLDVGCGAGAWGLAFAPGAEVVGLDLPDVLGAFVDAAGRTGARHATIAGDVHAVEVPSAAFDLVVVANLLRLEPADRAASLLARAATAVAPGGRLVVVDALADQTPEQDVARTLYAVHLALRVPGGRVHPSGDVAAWLRGAGLVEPERVDLPGTPGALGALVARRPS